MKNSIFLIVLLFIVMQLPAASTAQSGGKGEYFKAMGEALGQMGAAQTPEDYVAVSNRFKMIANKEKKEWLPNYYQAHSLILASFSAQEAARRDAYLDQALPIVEQLLEDQENEAEVHTLHALYFTGRLVIDPMSRGQKYTIKSNMAIREALLIDAKNPRARYLDLANKMGSAPYMGIDPTTYCADLNQLLADWENHKLKSPIHPQWGKGQAADLQKSCK